MVCVVVHLNKQHDKTEVSKFARTRRNIYFFHRFDSIGSATAESIPASWNLTKRTQTAGEVNAKIIHLREI